MPPDSKTVRHGTRPFPSASAQAPEAVERRVLLIGERYPSADQVLDQVQAAPLPGHAAGADGAGRDRTSDLERFQIRWNLKPLQVLELSHFLDANRCPLRLKML